MMIRNLFGVEILVPQGSKKKKEKKYILGKNREKFVKSQIIQHLFRHYKKNK